MILLLIAGGIYVLVIASFFYGWEKLKKSVPRVLTKNPFISVIVPMRNEEKNITLLIQDLLKQDYTLSDFEIIIVDDHSGDRSQEIVKLYTSGNLKLVSLPEVLSGKKAALLHGIQGSRGEIIMTTDADCRVGPQWISSFACFFADVNPVMLFAPVVASASKSVMEKILSLELFSLLGSTAGSAAIGMPVMCNGANLAFKRDILPEIEHLYQNERVKSGDDIFVLLELKKKYPERVHFLKSNQATVFTEVPSTMASFFRQRGRWVSKASYYRDFGIIFTALIVLFVNVLLAFSFCYGLIKGTFMMFFMLLLIKSLIDFPFLCRVTSFFKQLQLMIWFPVVQSFYFMYVCSSVLVALFAPLSWKGRNLS